jgi:hypothetical protein
MECVHFDYCCLILDSHNDMHVMYGKPLFCSAYMVKIVQLCAAPLSKLAQVCILCVKTWHDRFIQLSSLSGMLCRRIWFTKEV